MLMERVIGHQGCMSLAPGNSLVGIEKAQQLGLRWIELDGVLLGDGTVVIDHDAKVKEGLWRRSLWTEKRSLELAHLNQKRERGFFKKNPIPTLKEALELTQRLKLGLNLELKRYAHPAWGLVDRVLKELESCSCEMVLSSFDHEILALCAQHAPWLPRGYVFSKLPVNWSFLVTSVGARCVHVRHKSLTQANVLALKQYNLEVYSYTVNRKGRAEKLFAWGVDGIFTDRPQDYV